MYLEYWGLQKFPFENVPDPEFMYYSSEHEEALVRLVYAVKRNKGAVMVSGEIGCGKTMLSRVFIQQLPDSEYDVGLITNPSLEPIDFLREAIYQIGLNSQSNSKPELLSILNSRMLENTKNNRSMLLIIDEAQLIPKDTFEEIRLLLNFQLNERFLLNLVLLGQPELREMPARTASIMRKDSAIVLFGGLAKERPYPGSTTVTTVNGGISALVRTMAIELAPVRVNAIHPGIVGDSPYWADKHEAIERARSRTPTGRLATMQDITAAVVALLENPGINGVDLYVDGGWVLL